MYTCTHVQTQMYTPELFPQPTWEVETQLHHLQMNFQLHPFELQYMIYSYCVSEGKVKNCTPTVMY